MLKKLIPFNARKWLTLVGGVLIHFSLGSIYTFPNMTPYLTSYLRQNSSIKYSETNWISSVVGISMSLSSFITGLLITKFSLNMKLVLFIGCCINSLGVGLTYFTIKSSFYLTLLTYGIITGVGIGLAYLTPLSIVMKWFPESKGKANSAILFGLGAGGILFNQIQTNFVNPDNLSPNCTIANQTNCDKYFMQPELLEKVPSLFLVLAATYFSFQIVGNLLIFQNDESEFEKKEKKYGISINSLQNLEEPETNLQQEKFESSKSEFMDRKIEVNSLGVNYSSPDDGLTLQESMKKVPFYQMTVMMASFIIGPGLATSYYKQFGQSYISNDKFLAIIGSVSSFFNAFGRLFWGYLIDRLSFKTCYLISSSLVIAEVGTIYFTKFINLKEIYLIWVCAIYFQNCSLYVLASTAVAKTFGQKHFNTIYGLMLFFSLPSSLVVSTLGEFEENLSWLWIFLIGCLFCLTGFLVAIFFNVKNASKKNI